MKDAVILACSSFTDYIARAKEKTGNTCEVKWLDERLHRDPSLMNKAVSEALASLPENIGTVLVGMGFCGGSWDGVTARQRIVFPKADDCVSILLHTPEKSGYDLKQKGHLYVKCKDPGKQSFKKIFLHMTEGIDPDTVKRYHQDWIDLYDEIDIIETGLYDTKDEKYTSPVKEDADFLHMRMCRVLGSNTVMEKLLAGIWDDGFVIFEPGEKITEEKIRG